MTNATLPNLSPNDDDSPSSGRVAPFKTIRIIGKRYKMKWIEDFEDCGQCDVNNQIISIKADMPGDLELDTILHEIAHAIDYGMKLNMTERQVHGIGSGFAQILMDNTKLLNYLIYLKKKGEGDDDM